MKSRCKSSPDTQQPPPPPGTAPPARPLQLTLVFSMQSILTAAQSSHHSDWLSLISMVLGRMAGPVWANEKKVHM